MHKIGGASMLLKVDPITFEKSTIIGEKIKAYSELERKVKTENFRTKTQSTIGKLKELNDFIYSGIIRDELWKLIPSDTRFPGYYSSLADHVLATASIAVPLAVEVLKRGFDFASEYENEELKNILYEKNVKGVIEVTRLLSLLHDVGKHPPREHYIRTREYVKKFLDSFGLDGISEPIAKSASRHHYRYDIAEEFKPKNKLEWIVAFADKISSTQERGISGEFTELVEPYRWLLRVGNGEENTERIERIVNFIEYIKSRKWDTVKNYIDDSILYTTIPINFSQLQKIDEKIFDASNILDAKIGVLCIEVAGIHKFVTASDYKKYISGASALIDDALNEAKREIEKMLCPECIIYAKGGSLLAIIPPSYFKEIEEKICRVFEDKTRVVRLKLPKSIEFELWELKYGPRVYRIDNTDIEMLLKLAEKRNFGSVVSSVIDSLETTEEVGNPEIIRVGEICPICHEYRKSEHKRLIDGEERVCKRCYLAIKKDEELRGKGIYIINLEKEQPEVKTPIELKPDISYTGIIKKVREILENKLRNNPVVAEFKLRGVNGINFVPVRTWDCIGRQHIGRDYSEECDEVYDIAFIKGDGDNFGKIKGDMSSITLYRQISKLFEEIIEGSIAEALSEVILKQLEIKLEKDVKDSLMLELPFDVVFVGGDDFLVLIDAAFIFIFLMAFRESLQKKLGKRKDKYDKNENESLSIIPLGVSMGVAVVKNRMPIKSTLDVLDELLYRSKRKSKSEVSGFGGEIFVSLKKFESIPTKDEVKEVFDTNVKHTQFPMSGEELVNFIEDLRFFAQREVSPNWIKGVFGDDRSPVDSYVNLLYRLARTDKGTKEWEMLERIEHMHRDELKHVERFVFKHVDVAESLEIVSGRLSAEGLTKEIVLKIVLKLLGDKNVD